MSGTPPRVSEAGREKCAVRGSREAERGKQQGLVGVRCSQRAPEYIQQGSPGAYTSPRGRGQTGGVEGGEGTGSNDSMGLLHRSPTS